MTGYGKRNGLAGLLLFTVLAVVGNPAGAYYPPYNYQPQGMYPQQYPQQQQYQQQYPQQYQQPQYPQQYPDNRGTTQNQPYWYPYQQQQVQQLSPCQPGVR